MKKILYSKTAIALKTNLIKALTNNAVGWLLRAIYRNKIPHNSKILDTSNPIINNRLIGYIFFNAYESSELRYVKQYMFSHLPVVEIGSSIGVVSLAISDKTNQPIFSIEANPDLISTLRENIRLNSIKNCRVFNTIIASSNEKFYFERGGDTTTGRIDTTYRENAVEVDSISLSSFLSDNAIDEYILVCDIEGAEVYIIKDDAKALENCKQIIIELHPTMYQGKKYTIDELSKALEQLGFQKTAAYVANAVYTKN